MKLRPHQIEAKDQILNNDLGIIHLPTGSGKTRILYGAIADDVIASNTCGVYVVVAPKLLLIEQLLKEARDQFLAKNIQVMYHVVGSGNIRTNTRESEYAEGLSPVELSRILSIQISSSTNMNDIEDMYKKSLVAYHGEPMPLIIISTYDSAKKIVHANLPHIKQVHYDEAHYLLRAENRGLLDINGVDFLKADKRIFYTATLKNTLSDIGVGMNNKSRFGEIIYFKSPAEIIATGDIVRPRLHVVDSMASVTAQNDLEADASAVIAAFNEHTTYIRTGAKMLVVTKGSAHLDDISTSSILADFHITHPALKIFDISSNYGARVNGIEVSRKEFLKQLNSLKDEDEAIIFHVRILTEGVDVTGITGVMFMTEPDAGLGDILQNIGRATRLHKKDRKSIHELLEFLPSETDKMLKPYAWVIVPSYGTLGPDLKQRLQDVVYSIRDYDFSPSQDVFINDTRGESPDPAIAGVNVLNTQSNILQDMILSITHELEQKDIADRLKMAEDYIRNEINVMDADELIDTFTI
jgi:superfamily II DNA or RNA helicase